MGIEGGGRVPLIVWIESTSEYRGAEVSRIYTGLIKQSVKIRIIQSVIEPVTSCFLIQFKSQGNRYTTLFYTAII